MAADRLLRLAVSLLACATLAGCAAAAPASPRACSFGAFVEETDSAGLNVRAAPNASAAVLGTLPPTWADAFAGGFQVRVEVEVTAAADGWFRIRHARDNEELTGRSARPVYGGEGWVSGRKLVVKSQATGGRARPASGAPVVLRLGEGDSFDNDTMVAAGRLVGCDGVWALVEYADDRLPAEVRGALHVAPAARSGLPAGRFRAWVDQVCALQETSCDGPGR
ncbi:SH3 domain-containing protein [Aquabacterium sp. A7-Y]|uniref:SH3 domain-containing protein n=1 Tax=Aquabacterium sp. A7-Y TaxID=1349605 RepID=UPI00223C99E2|nr:SH3 domain-containing protein [Aquabacterium sp. A7-Y]MCW7538998.1 SH3 domain-containing protein [Aquabacterium sp. A7-Y]